jgi:hypothetical protein
MTDYRSQRRRRAIPGSSDAVGIRSRRRGKNTPKIRFPYCRANKCSSKIAGLQLVTNVGKVCLTHYVLSSLFDPILNAYCGLSSSRFCRNSSLSRDSTLSYARSSFASHTTAIEENSSSPSNNILREKVSMECVVEYCHNERGLLLVSPLVSSNISCPHPCRKETTRDSAALVSGSLWQN